MQSRKAIQVGVIPNADSQLLCAIAVARILRRRGHGCRIALDPGNPLYPVMAVIAAQEGEATVPLELLRREPPQAVLFDSQALVPNAFRDALRINFLPGVFWQEKDSLHRLEHFAMGNFVFAPNRVFRGVHNFFQAPVPALGLPAVGLYRRDAPIGDSIVYPDGHPFTQEGRRRWFDFLASLAAANPDREVLIKERFSPAGYAHLPWLDFSSCFGPDTPPNLKCVPFGEDTRQLLATAGCVVGVESGALVEAALLGRTVHLLQFPDGPVNGMIRGADTLGGTVLRAEAEDCLRDLAGAPRLERETLAPLMPLEFLAETFVEALEGLFEAFPDPERRNALALHFAEPGDLGRGLEALRQDRRSSAWHAAWNLARYEACCRISAAARALSLVRPCLEDAEFSAVLQTELPEFAATESPEALQAAVLHWQGRTMERLAGAYVTSALPQRLREEDLYAYEGQFVFAAFPLVAALQRLGRGAEAGPLEAALQDRVRRMAMLPAVRYAYAVALKRDGLVDTARGLLLGLLAEPSLERAVHCGAHYHLGMLHVAAGEAGQAVVCFQRCLDVEPGHGMAARQLRALVLH